MMTPQERREMRREQVERRLPTTMAIKNRCALNGVLESTMYGWVSRFRKKEAGSLAAGQNGLT